MTNPEDVFGEDFVEHVQERTAERRQERNQLTEEQKAKVAHLAVNEGKFEEGDPQFTYTTENGITHNVMYVQLPDPDNQEVWEHLSEPWDGAARIPLEYLGQWYWSTFPNKKDVADLEQGMHFIVVGAVEVDEGDNGEQYHSIYPVRATMMLDEAQELAEAYTGDGSFEEENPDDDFSEDAEEETEADDEPEPEPEEDEAEQEEDDEDDSDDDGLNFGGGSDESSGGGGGLDGLMSEGEEEEEEDESEEDNTAVPYEDIAAMVEEMADSQDPEEEPQVYEVEEGSEHHKRITQVVCNKLEIDDLEAAGEVVIDVIDEHREEEEEEDETNKLF